MGKKSKHILLIDGENILHQSFHKFEKLKSTDGKPSGAIFGFFKSLHMYVNRLDPDELYISFDNGHSSIRDELTPNYKGHRKNISIDYESLQSQKAEIMKILKYLRIPYIFDKNKLTNYEGDDFLAYLALRTFKDEKITIISSDKDFNQLISDKLKIFSPRKEEYVRLKNCKEIFGYDPDETVDYLSLVGDKSDDIEGYPGMGPVKTRKFLDQYGTIMEYLYQHPEDKQMAEVYHRNKKMIDLRWYIENVPLDQDELPIKLYKDGQIKLKKFKEICITYSLSSFLSNNFLKVFTDLNKKAYE